MTNKNKNKNKNKNGFFFFIPSFQHLLLFPQISTMSDSSEVTTADVMNLLIGEGRITTLEIEQVILNYNYH